MTDPHLDDLLTVASTLAGQLYTEEQLTDLRAQALETLANYGVGMLEANTIRGVVVGLGIVVGILEMLEKEAGIAENELRNLLAPPLSALMVALRPYLPA